MEADFRIAAVQQRNGVARWAARRSAPAHPHPWPARLRQALHRWWQRLSMDEMTAHLSEATCHVDLEYRIRAWNDVDRRGRRPLL